MRTPRPVAVGLMIALGAAGCYSHGREGPGHRSQTLALTPEQEWSLGRQAYQEVLSKSKVIRGGPEVERIRSIGRRIVQATEIEPLRREINLRLEGYRWAWEFNLLTSEQVNAFCMPGGLVAVFTSLLPVAENDDQLATVMSHEIAHALAHHASERIAREQKYEHALQAINSALGNLDPQRRRQLIGLLAAGAHTGTLAYDRQQESEADHIGLFLMTFAGYDPEQALAFWQRMTRAAGRGRMPEILSDHPSDARRMDQLRQWISHARAALRAWKMGDIAPPGRSK